MRKFLLVITGIVLGTAVALAVNGQKPGDVPETSNLYNVAVRSGSMASGKNNEALQGDAEGAYYDTGGIREASTGVLNEATVTQDSKAGDSNEATVTQGGKAGDSDKVTVTQDSKAGDSDKATVTQDSKAGDSDEATVTQDNTIEDTAIGTGMQGGAAASGIVTSSPAAAAGEETSKDIFKLSAVSALLVDEKTGDVLYAKNANKKMYPASTTKIMTALLAIENWNTNDVLKVGDEANKSAPDASKAGLDYGEKITMGNLLKGLLLPSGSDAAYVIAVHTARKVSGDQNMSINKAVDYFSNMMNKRAKELGALNTHFVTPDGYHDPDHYSTAHDIALIAEQAMKKLYFREVVSTVDFSMKDWNGKTNDNPDRYWKNTNRLIHPDNEYYFKYANGIKTGYTDEAGYCLVSSAEKDGRNVIAVVLDGTEEGYWTDSITLLKYGLGIK